MTNITFRNKGRRFRCLSLKWHKVKNTVKSFVRENKLHTCLTRETLPAEERVSKFYNHGKTPSYQTFADASMRKIVPKILRKYLEGIEEKAPLRFETGTECHDHLREVVGRSRQNCFPRSKNNRLFYYCFIDDDCMAELLSLTDLKVTSNCR